MSEYSVDFHVAIAGLSQGVPSHIGHFSNRSVLCVGDQGHRADQCFPRSAAQLAQHQGCLLPQPGDCCLPLCSKGLALGLAPLLGFGLAGRLRGAAGAQGFAFLLSGEKALAVGFAGLAIGELLLLAGAEQGPFRPGLFALGTAGVALGLLRVQSGLALSLLGKDFVVVRLLALLPRHRAESPHARQTDRQNQSQPAPVAGFLFRPRRPLLRQPGGLLRQPGRLFRYPRGLLRPLRGLIRLAAGRQKLLVGIGQPTVAGPGPGLPQGRAGDQVLVALFRFGRLPGPQGLAVDRGAQVGQLALQPGLVKQGGHDRVGEHQLALAQAHQAGQPQQLMVVGWLHG